MESCKQMCCQFCAKWANRNLSLLLIRLALGAIFLAHGWQKIQMMDQVVAFFGQMGLPAFIAYLVTWIEFLAGIALILGIGTCVAGLLLAIIMIGSMFIIIKGGATLIAGPASPMAYELNLMLLAASLGMVFAGPGRYSLGAKMKGRCGDAGCTDCK